MKKILWLSRHKPHEAQEAELRRLYGEDVWIKRDRQTWRSASECAHRIRAENPLAVVIVAPLSVIAALCKQPDLPPLLWAECREALANERGHFRGARGRWFLFERFMVIEEVRMVLREVQG